MIVLLTCFAPDSHYGGAAIVRGCLEAIPESQIHWIALAGPANMVPVASKMLSIQHYKAPGFASSSLRLGRFWEVFNVRCWSGRVAKKIARTLAELDPSVVWIVADADVMSVANRLLPHLEKRRLHLTFHDDPMSTAVGRNRSRGQLNQIDAFMKGIAQRPFSADAVTEELLADCAPSADRTALITAPVLSKNRLPFKAFAGTNTLNIGYVGNFYGAEEFQCFVSGLQQWSHTTGREWSLSAFGDPALGNLDPRVNARGYTPMEEVRQILSQCDLLLLPLPVDPNSRAMQTCLPTKLISYIELGCPVFTFAPHESATARIMRDASIGPVVTNLDPGETAAALEELYRWDRGVAESGWSRLVQDRFNEARIYRDFRDIISA